MDNEVVFAEKQKFHQWWLWMLLAGVNVLLLFGVYWQVIHGQQWGDKPMSNIELLGTAAFVVLLTILFFNFRLETKIKKDGIYVKFFPFHLSFRKYSWDKIDKAFVRTYHPIAEYGGWGLRLGLWGSGKAFNISGNKGLQLEFSNHIKLLIGTKKPRPVKGSSLQDWTA